MLIELRRSYGSGELWEGASWKAPALHATAPTIGNRKGVHSPDTDLQTYFHRELNSLSSQSYSLVDQS